MAEGSSLSDATASSATTREEWLRKREFFQSLYESDPETWYHAAVTEEEGLAGIHDVPTTNNQHSEVALPGPPANPAASPFGSGAFSWGTLSKLVTGAVAAVTSLSRPVAPDRTSNTGERPSLSPSLGPPHNWVTFVDRPAYTFYWATGGVLLVKCANRAALPSYAHSVTVTMLAADLNVRTVVTTPELEAALEAKILTMVLLAHSNPRPWMDVSLSTMVNMRTGAITFWLQAWLAPSPDGVSWGKCQACWRSMT